MDIQRTLLIGAIMLLSFMLLTEWVNFRDVKDDVVLTETRLTATSGVQGDTNDANGLATELPGDSDVPAALPDIQPISSNATNSVEDIPAVGASVDTSNPARHSADQLQRY